MSLLFHTLSRFLIVFLPWSMGSFNFMADVTIHSAFGAQENKVSHCFPIYLPWSDGTVHQDLTFWMLRFKWALSLSSFTFIKKLFSSSSLSAIRVVSSAYLRWLIFLPAIFFFFCLLPVLFLFYFFLILFLNFTILYWFCQISKWICHRYTCWFQLVLHPAWYFAWCTLHTHLCNLIELFRQKIIQLSNHIRWLSICRVSTATFSELQYHI